MIDPKVIDKVVFALSLGTPPKEISKMYGVGLTKVYELKKLHKNQDIKEHKDSVVGIIGDTHFPYVRKGYLEFCLDTFNKMGVTEVVHIGDMIDFHDWSRFQSEPDAVGGISEFEQAFECVQTLNTMFGKWNITLTLGNHDNIPQRQLKSLGLPPFLLKSFGELFEISHWDICTSKIIDGVKYKHGIKSTSTRRAAERAGINSVWGHCHSMADIQSSASKSRLVWGMHVGCGFDYDSYAARYGREDELKPIISCGTVINGKKPQLHYMSL